MKWDPWIVDKEEVIVNNGVVSSAHQLASQAGLEMLMNGGNAVDAGAATSCARNKSPQYKKEN
jgi:gamma-glutamyltranspeptidase/glutathione hydrolase